MYIIICVDIEMTDALGFLPSHCFPAPIEAFTCSLILLLSHNIIWGLGVVKLTSPVVYYSVGGSESDETSYVSLLVELTILDLEVTGS